MTPKVYETLNSLSLEDWNQRYSNSWVCYNEKLRYCLSIEPGHNRKVMLYAKPSYFEKPKEKEVKVKPQEFFVDPPGLDDMVPLHRLVRPEPRLVQAVGGGGGGGAGGGFHIQAENARIQDMPLEERMIRAQAKIKKIEQVPEDAIAKILLDPLLIDIRRPNAGWYYNCNGNLFYLYYTDEKQYSRGFTQRNTFLWFPKADYWERQIVAIGDALEIAYKNFNDEDIKQGIKKQLDKKEDIQLSRQLVVIPVRSYSLIYFRLKQIGELYVNEKKIRLFNRFFKPEMQQYLPGYDVSVQPE